MLADAFDTFIETCYKEHIVNPIYFFTLPGFTEKANLKNTEIELKNIQERFFLILEIGIGGTISGCKRKGYEITVNDKKVLHIHSRNPFGFGMSESLFLLKKN